MQQLGPSFDAVSLKVLALLTRCNSEKLLFGASESTARLDLSL